MLYGISTSTSSPTPVMPAVLIVVGIGVIVLFFRRQQKLDNPILQVQVLRHREFLIITIIILFLEGVLIGGSVLFPLYIQNALQASATVSGLIMLPGALIGAFFGLLSGKLFDKYGVRGISVTGALVLLAGGIGYVLLGNATPLLITCVAYTVVTLGIQALITPLNTWGINSLPNIELPHGNAIVATIEQVGSSLGTAFVVSLTALSSLYATSETPAAEVSYIGCHFAFMGMLLLTAVIAILILVFVRDKKATYSATALEAGAMPGIDRPWLVADIMNANPSTLPATAKIRDAIAIMQETETNGVPLVDDADKVVGFLSDGDILKFLSRHESSQTDGVSYIIMLETDSFQERIRTVYDLDAMRLATKSVITVDADEQADLAFRTLADKKIKKAPVVKDGKLVGTLSRRNIMKALNIMEQAIEAK